MKPHNSTLLRASDKASIVYKQSLTDLSHARCKQSVALTPLERMCLRATHIVEAMGTFAFVHLHLHLLNSV